ARYSRRTRPDPALVEDQDVLTPAEPAGTPLPCQMPGRGQPVDACADDDIPAVSGDHRTFLPDLRRAAAQYVHKVARTACVARAATCERSTVPAAWLPRCLAAVRSFAVGAARAR